MGFTISCIRGPVQRINPRYSRVYVTLLVLLVLSRGEKIRITIVSKKSEKISFYLFESRQSFVRSYKAVKHIFVEENIRKDYFFFEIELFDRQLLMSSRSSEAIARVEIQVRSTNNLHFRNDDLLLSEAFVPTTRILLRETTDARLEMRITRGQARYYQTGGGKNILNDKFNLTR